MTMKETISCTDDARSRPSYSYRDIWKIVFPLLLSSIVEQLVGMTDTAFLGRVGEIELGASALGGIFFIVVFMLILGFCSGAQILMGTPQWRKKTIKTSVWCSITALLSSLSPPQWFWCSFNAPALFYCLISSVRPKSLKLRGPIWSGACGASIFSMVACLFRAFFIATTQTGTLKFNAVVMVLCQCCV